MYLLPGQKKKKILNCQIKSLNCKSTGQKRISPHPVVYFGPESHLNISILQRMLKIMHYIQLQEPTSSDRKQEYFMYIYITCMWISSARRKVKMALRYIFQKLQYSRANPQQKDSSRDTTTFPIRLCRKPPEQTHTKKRRSTHQTSYKMKTLMLWYVGSDKNKVPFGWIYDIIIAVVLDTAVTVHVESAHVVYQDMILCCRHCFKRTAKLQKKQVNISTFLEFMVSVLLDYIYILFSCCWGISIYYVEYWLLYPGL